MKMFRKVSGSTCVLLILLVFVLTACASATAPLRDIASEPLSITILHVGDTHSYVIPHDVMLKINDQDTLVTLGGWSLLAAAVEDMRLREKNVMLLHSGDVTVGTIWTPKFEGMADFAAMNALTFDAVTPGNHDFDKGTQLVASMADTLEFPVLAANLDISQEPSLEGRIKPYAILEYEGQKLGVIGLITPDTATIASPGNTLKFLPPEESAPKYIAELNGQGINKIVVLSHLGYEPDLKLARSVPGIDIIVGGHSHTLMGGEEFTQIGLKPETAYPTELRGPGGDKVLIVHAWEYNQMLGQITLNFDDRGRISSYSGQPFIYTTNSFKLEDSYGWNHLCSCQPQFGAIMATVSSNPRMRIYWSSTDMDRVLQPYVGQVAAELNSVIGIADEDLIRAPDKGPGSLVADAFLGSARKVNPAVELSLYDTYDVRADIFKGPILANDIIMVLPLQQNLVTMTVKGSLLKVLLEKGLDAHIAIQMPPPCFEISGFRMTIDTTRPSGDRITDIQAETTDGEYAPMDMDADYTLVCTDFMAKAVIAHLLNDIRWLGPLADSVRERMTNYLKYTPLGIRDVDAMTDYIKLQKNIKKPPTLRTTLIQPDE